MKQALPQSNRGGHRTTLEGRHGQGHYQHMAKTRTQPSTLDLFSTASAREPSSPLPLGSRTTAAPLRRYVLPNDLTNAIKQLEDKELDQLFSAVLAEQKRRGKNRPNSDEGLPKRWIEVIAVPLTQGKLNAVRAAFKAGITPSRIARQFGISQSDVRKALANTKR